MAGRRLFCKLSSLLLLWISVDPHRHPPPPCIGYGEGKWERKKLKRLASATCLLALHVRLSTQNEMLIFKKQILIFLSKRIMLISNIFWWIKKQCSFFHPLLICAFKIPKNHLKFLLENNKNNSLKNLCSYVLKN